MNENENENDCCGEGLCAPHAAELVIAETCRCRECIHALYVAVILRKVWCIKRPSPEV